MTNFIVKQKPISGKCVGRVTIQLKIAMEHLSQQMVAGVMILDLPNVQIMNSKVDGRIVKLMDGATSNTVRKNKVCSDQKWAGETERFTTDRTIKGRPYIWMKQGAEIGKSTEACKGKQYNTGNEAILEGVKITGDRLRNIELDGTLAENLTFYFDTSDECEEECSSRIGVCGAWSYDNFEGVCYLHTVDSCCGQFGKRETISGFTSGYVCRHCWSTKSKTDCHCSVKQRTQMPGTRHSSGAKQPLHNSATGELSVHEIEIGTDLCACEYRKVGRRGRKRCKCAKPQCKHSFFNPTGKCQDPRRCRTSRRVFNPDKITPC